MAAAVLALGTGGGGRGTTAGPPVLLQSLMVPEQAVGDQEQTLPPSSRNHGVHVGTACSPRASGRGLQVRTSGSETAKQVPQA